MFIPKFRSQRCRKAPALGFMRSLWASHILPSIRLSSSLRGCASAVAATTFASDAHHPIFSAEMPLFFLACPMKSLSLNLSFPLTRGAVMISATFIVTLGSVVKAKPGAETLCRAVLENKHQGHFTFANSPLDNWDNISICQYVNMSISQYLNILPKNTFHCVRPWFQTGVSTPQPCHGVIPHSP